jgi:Uma2 family endonuclease
MEGILVHKPRNTGPLELRDHGPSGRRLGTFDDCYDGSPWELHRGELVEQVRAKDIHSILMALVAALFRTHARQGLTVMTDVYCDLSDENGPSLRAPDVVLVEGLGKGKDDNYHGTPMVAVEIRGTQSKRYLEEKVKLYQEHGWPCTWIVHPDREEIEVVRPALASVTYRRAASLPLVPELDKYGLAAMPVSAFFDEVQFAQYCDGWVATRGRLEGAARMLLTVLGARGLRISAEQRQRVSACTDADQLEEWVTCAATASSVDEIFATR